MKDINTPYEQYNNLNWENQDITGLHAAVYQSIIDFILNNHADSEVSLFDMGFGTGVFLQNLIQVLPNKYSQILLEGCEPSKSYDSFKSPDNSGVKVKLYKKEFLDFDYENKFNFLTSVYVMVHFKFDELESVIKKIKTMLKSGGFFIFVVASEGHFNNTGTVVKLENFFDLIESTDIEYNNKTYKEFFTKVNIPGIGEVYDYNREESLYVDMFKQNGFTLDKKIEVEEGIFTNSILFLKNN